MKAPPRSTKHSLTVRLNDHARIRWPELAGVDLRFRANFAYLEWRYADGTAIKLCRLRYGGSAHSAASPSTAPATTTTKTPSSRPAHP